MNIQRNGSQPSAQGPADWFTGTVRIDPLFPATGPARATAFREAHITPCDSLETFHAHWTGENPDWLYTPWADSCEPKKLLSKQHKFTIRCLPIAEAKLPESLHAASGKCFLTGQETTPFAIWGRSY